MKNSTIPALYHAENSAPWAFDGPKSSFIINYVTNGYQCINFAMPDIAGIGVVLSTVIQTLLTTAALLAVVYLEYQTKKQKDLNKNKRYSWWRKSLRAFIRVSGDTALITALALLVSAFVNLPLTSDRDSNLLQFQDAYFTLCVYTCCAFSSIHLASLLVLRDRVAKHPKSTYIRMTLLSIFGILLTVTISLSRYAFEPFFVEMQRFLVGCLKMSERFEFVMEYFLPAALITYIFWISIYQVVRREEEHKGNRSFCHKLFRFVVFGHWKVCLVVQVLFAGVSVVSQPLPQIVLVSSLTVRW
jgi:hypothetical protein